MTKQTKRHAVIREVGHANTSRETLVFEADDTDEVLRRARDERKADRIGARFFVRTLANG